MRATTLFSVLATQTILNVTDTSDIQQSCRLCGKPFMVKHGRQRFCSEQHANLYRLRKHRSKSREHS